MQKIILYKHHPIVQLGHLYEHLFVTTVKQHMASVGLFRFRDYMIWGTTYDETGVVESECTLFTTDAQVRGSEIRGMRVEWGDDNSAITNALHQISAEESNVLHITDKHAVLEELRDLDAKEWSTKNIWADASAENDEPLYLTDQENSSKRIVKIRASASDLVGMQRAVFNQLSRYILAAVADEVCRQFGYYDGELYGEQSPLSMTSELIVANEIVEGIDIEALRRMLEGVVQHVTKPHELEKLVAEYAALTDTTSIDQLPDADRIYQETGQRVEPAQWQNIVTIENFSDIVDKLKVDAVITTKG